MKRFEILCVFPCVIAVSLLCGQPARGQAASEPRGGSAQATGKYPKDIDPDSRNRLPLVQREELDELGKKLYDEVVKNARSTVGFQGPGGLRLISPRLAETTEPVHRYLRYETDMDPRLVELAILVTAREFDQQFEWVQHEIAARKTGLEANVIDVVKHRKPVTGLGEKEATIIQWGRELFRAHKVSSDTFARALKLFGKQGLVNLASTFGQWTTTAILLTTFDQQLAPDQKPLLPVP